MEIKSEETFALGRYIVSSKKGHQSARSVAGKTENQAQQLKTSRGPFGVSKSSHSPTEVELSTLIKVLNIPMGHQEKVTFMLARLFKKAGTHVIHFIENPKHSG